MKLLNIAQVLSLVHLGAIKAVVGVTKDNRYTPILATVVSEKHGTGQSTLYYNILDSNTRGNQGWFNDYLPEESDVYTRVNKFAHRPTTDTTTVVMCKNIATKNPCDPDFYHEFDYVEWNEDTVFLWLESEHLCNQASINDKEHGDPNYQALKSGFNKRCDNLVRIEEIQVDDVYSDRSATLELMIKVDKAFPGHVNQKTMDRLREDWGIYALGQTLEPYAPISMTCSGESVSSRTCNLQNNFILDEYVKDKSSDFPDLKISNLGHRSMTPIAYYACESTDPKYQYQRCKELSQEPTQTREVFKNIHPDIAMIHDQHWHTDYDENPDNFALKTAFDRMLSVNLMIDNAISNGVDGIFFYTVSISDDSDNIENEGYYEEMQNLMEVIDFLGCDKDDNNSILFSVVDWGRLVCPTVETGKCPQKAHGFDEILPDGTHPSGESGEWLTYNALSLVMSETALRLLPNNKGGKDFKSWDDAMTNPINKQVLALAPPDNNPPLEDLISSYYICPDIQKQGGKHNFSPLEQKHSKTTFPKYNSYKDNKKCLS